MFSEGDIFTLENASQGCQNASEISLMGYRIIIKMESQNFE